MMTSAYLKLEGQGLTKDPEVRAINKELRNILEVKTTSDIFPRKTLPLRRRSLNNTSRAAENTIITRNIS